MLNSTVCPMSTGDCVAAAARAATADLLLRIKTETVSITHAAGIVTIPVVRENLNCDNRGCEYVCEMSGGTPGRIEKHGGN